MNPAAPTLGLDPVTLQQVLQSVETQVAAALWLSAGMVIVFALIIALACGWRRVALGLGALYFLTLCFVPNGHARVLGPVGAAIAVLGLCWPDRRRRSP